MFLSGAIFGVALTKHLLGVPIFGGKPDRVAATVTFLNSKSSQGDWMMTIMDRAGISLYSAQTPASFPSFCSDGAIWFARKDGSCWIVDRPKS